MSIRMLHIIVFFRMMFFIAVKEQGLALFMGKGTSGNKTRLCCNGNQEDRSCYG